MSHPLLVCVAWPYANGPRHIGHVAGFGVPSDIFARYHRMAGHEVLMVSGTDEHGTPITVQAEQEGLSPRELADRYNTVICEDLHRLGLSYDLFTRTTTPNHYAITQEFFRTLYAKGYIFKRPMMGAFHPKSGHTLPDRYIEGICPYCQNPEARGDQCDHCGKQLDPTELIHPRSKTDGSTPQFRESEQFFLDLPAFAQPLREWLETHQNWRDNVRNFSLNLLQELQPRPITRDMAWGVPIPLAEYAGRNDKRIYVWFDAVVGYLSASIEWAQRKGDPERWTHWWRNPNAHHYYFMGKDNIVFHSIIWPSMLMGYGKGLANPSSAHGSVIEGGDSSSPSSLGGGAGLPLELPRQVISSEFLTMEGKKFSSSRGIVIYVRDFLERYTADTLRFFLTIAGPESQDTDFTWAEFVRRNNTELVGNWGNLIHRVLSMTRQAWGRIPQPGDRQAEDLELIARVEGGFVSVGRAIQASQFKQALNECLALATEANRYIHNTEPWRLLREAGSQNAPPPERERAATVLHTALHAIDNLNLLFSPFLPFSSAKLHTLLGHKRCLGGTLQMETTSPTDGGAAHLLLCGDYSAAQDCWKPTTPRIGAPLPETPPLFPKLDTHLIDEELDRMRKTGS